MSLECEAAHVLPGGGHEGQWHELEWVARPLFHGMALEVELVGQVLEQLEFPPTASIAVST